MNSPLNVPEILELCLRELGDNRKSLASFARTNRTFSRASLRILWQSLHSTTPLFQLLPNDALSHEDNRPPTVV
jgi:hypothetical protein